jgi:hypothetical protein
VTRQQLLSNAVMVNTTGVHPLTNMLPDLMEVITGDSVGCCCPAYDGMRLGLCTASIETLGDGCHKWGLFQGKVLAAL